MNALTSSRTAAVIAGIAAFGNLLLGIAHTGATVPLLSRIGPQGGAVPPAVVAFSVGTLVFGALAWGLWRGAAWARWVGLAVCALAILSGIGQFRGVVSAAGIVLAVVLGVLLLRSPTPAE